MSADQSIEVRPIAGFWRRLGAFLVDYLLLNVVGVAAGFFLTEEFARVGPWGRLLGFGVAVAYFGPLNSRLAGGQTLGKRLLKIRVVARNGEPLSVPTAILRFLPLGAPWFLNNAQFPDSVLFSFWSYVLSAVVFGVGLSISYLYVFNRRTRQSLHDLLVGSYVVSAGPTGPVAAAAPWEAHFAVCGLLIALSGVAPYFGRQFVESEPMAGVMQVRRAVRSEPWAAYSMVSRGQMVVGATGEGLRQSSFMRITACAKDPDIANAERARRVAALALAADRSVEGLDVIQVTLAYGYDIGIASSWRSQHYARSPADWRAQ